MAYQLKYILLIRVDMLLDCGALPRGMFEEKKEGEGGWDERVEKKKAAVEKWMESGVTPNRSYAC